AFAHSSRVRLKIGILGWELLEGGTMSSRTGPEMKKAQAPRFDAGHVPMSEELDSARWSLPPLVPVLIAAVVLGVVVGVYLLSSRKPPTSTGSALRVVALPLHIESKGSIAPGKEG